ncbi:MAG TPA: potassium channel family protein, partial [Methanomassiliicoccaceae archaeon]|nr:potassium channel family protein [Methanomassiliicoccaceae archaeon]
IYPGSFVDSANPSESMNFHTSMYYSFVTLATLGYGDIVPVTQEARGLVIVEVLTGVLYMAILISRLVGTWGVIRTAGTRSEDQFSCRDKRWLDRLG